MELTNEAVFINTRDIVNKHDPIDLIAIGCPEDEYNSEVEEILKSLPDVKNEEALGEAIWQIFVAYFDEQLAGDRKKYDRLARDIWLLRAGS